MPNLINYSKGQKVNNLIFLKEVKPYLKPNGKKERKALFRCYCGKEFESIVDRVKRGHIKSCGCFRRGILKRVASKHNLSNHPLYTVWTGMKQRCYNPNKSNYHRYGGRGIKVCNEWLKDFMNFYNWAIENGYKKGLNIDRENNDGNYEPSNCQWIKHNKNSQNRVSTKLSIEDVLDIRNAWLLGCFSGYEIAKAYRVSNTNIYNIINNKAWV